MNLQNAIDRYVSWRQAHGARFDTSARVLHYFSRHVGENTDCGSVADADVLSFLAGKGQLTRYRANKHGALTGFYRYAISRGYAAQSPLPAPEDEPRTPRSAPPYVYSHDELRRLFGSIDISRQRPVQLDANTLRALLLALYGAGLRFSEAQRLTLDDADLTDAVLTIRNTKFFKTRHYVPILQRKPGALRNGAPFRGLEAAQGARASADPAGGPRRRRPAAGSCRRLRRPPTRRRPRPAAPAGGGPMQPSASSGLCRRARPRPSLRTSTAPLWSRAPSTTRSRTCSRWLGFTAIRTTDGNLRASIPCATRRPCTGWNRGTAREPMCSGCCRCSPPGSATPISTGPRSTCR